MSSGKGKPDAKLDEEHRAAKTIGHSSTGASSCSVSLVVQWHYYRNNNERKEREDIMTVFSGIPEHTLPPWFTTNKSPNKSTRPDADAVRFLQNLVRPIDSKIGPTRGIQYQASCRTYLWEARGVDRTVLFVQLDDAELF